jgi:sugar phosphate isomerase/epimerase
MMTTKTHAMGSASVFPGLWTGIYHTLPLHQALARLQAEGWRAFEVSTEHLVALETAPDRDFLVDQAAGVIAALSIAVPQAHPLLKADVAAADAAARGEDIRRLLVHFALAARLGVKQVVVHPGGGRGITSRSEWQRVRAANVESFRRLGDEAAGLGLTIGIENMMRRGFASPFEMQELLAAIGHPAVKFTFDSSHANAAGFNLADYVVEMGGSLVALHLSDNDGSGDQHRVPGSGTIDWAALMAALRRVGYAGLLNLEIPGERHPDPDLQRLKLEHARRVAEWLTGSMS